MRVLLLLGALAAAVGPTTARDPVSVPADPLGKVAAAGEPNDAAPAPAPAGASIQVVQDWLATHAFPTLDGDGGYPFVAPSGGPWGRAAPSDIETWVTMVTSGRIVNSDDQATNGTANDTDASTPHRRLEEKDKDSANLEELLPKPQDVARIEDSLNRMAAVQSVETFANAAAMAATTWGAAAGFAVFTFVIGWIVSEQQKQLIIDYINAVADGFGRIAHAANHVESLVSSIVAVSLHKKRFDTLSSIAADLDTAVEAHKNSASAVRDSWSATCKSRSYFADFQYLKDSAGSIANDFKGASEYKVKKFLQLAVGYGIAYIKGYQVYTRCMATTASDSSTLQRILKNDASERDLMRKNMYVMANAAHDVTMKFTVQLLETTVKEAVDSRQTPSERLSKTFDAVSFRVSDFDGRCGDAKSKVFDVSCGVWPVQVGSRCYAVGWSTDRANIVVERARDNGYKNRYMNSAKQCGYYEDAISCVGKDNNCVRKLETAKAVYVLADKYTKFVEDTSPMKGVGDLKALDTVMSSTPNPATGLQNLISSAQNDSLTLADAMQGNDFQGIMKAIKREDPALYASLSLPANALLDNHKQYMAAIDNSVTNVNTYHGFLMDTLHKLESDIDETGGTQLQAMQELRSATTAQHNQQLAGIRNLDSSVTKLSASLDQGFASARSDIATIHQQTSAQLKGLLGTVSTVGAKTRNEVKSVIDQAEKLTTERLSSLSSVIAETNGAQLGGIAQLSDTIQETQRQAREDIEREFDARERQLRERVIATTYQITSSARLTVNTLVSVTDAMRTELGRQIQSVNTQLAVIDGRVTKISNGLDRVDKQLNDIIQLIYKLNIELSDIYRTIDNLPNTLRRELRVARVEGYLRKAAHLSFAYTNYLKHNMGQLYAGEFVRACEVNTYYKLYQNLLSELQPVALEPELRIFGYSRVDYEHFGTTVLGAAYHQRFMLVPCAAMRDGSAITLDDSLANVMWVFRANVEEKIPQFFLGAYAANARIADYLIEARHKWAATENFSLRAIEPVRARMQDDLGTYAYASFFNVPKAEQLQVWAADGLANASFGANRHGLARSPTGDWLALWSNTRMELPTAFRDRLQALDLPTTLDTDSLNAAFRGTPWQPYWDAGLVRAVARVAKVDDACPWAVSRSHYPLCWERASACQCVQLEGLPATPTAEAMTNRSLVPTDVALFTTFESATDPRSEFVTTATRQTRATASDASLAATAMRGVPANRVRFSLCMTSGEAVHTAHLVTGDAHEPPPQFTRCLASDQRTYNVVPDAVVANGGGSTFVRTGASVSEAMFRTLAIGDTVPEVTFFDAQDGGGNYIVCANCVMDELRTVFMFRVLSFKIGRPSREKSVVCERHPRLPNIEYCPQTATTTTTPAFWTPPVLLATELPRLVAHIGAGWEPGLADRVTMAERVSAGLATLLGPATDDFAYFKVYVSPAGAFDNTTDAYWTSLPSHEGREERGWTVVPAFYATRAPPPPFTSDDYVPVTLAYDALVMWSTLPAEPRRVAYHVMSKKPAGVSLKQYLGATFAAYGTERILRGFFAERMAANATECPVAGDTDHFAYCTPTPVDAQCMCVQLEDLPDEYRELYDGSAPNGRVVSFQGDAANATTAVASYVIGRSHQQSARPLLVDGRPWRNLSDASLCLQTDFSHPERGATCVVAPAGSGQPRGLRVELATAATPPSVAMGDRVSEVVVSTASWSARCRGCTDAVVSEMVQFQEDGSAVDVAFAGLVAGSYCATVSSDGGGELTVCVVETR